MVVCRSPKLLCGMVGGWVGGVWVEGGGLVMVGGGGTTRSARSMGVPGTSAVLCLQLLAAGPQAQAPPPHSALEPPVAPASHILHACPSATFTHDTGTPAPFPTHNIKTHLSHQFTVTRVKLNQTLSPTLQGW